MRLGLLSAILPTYCFEQVIDTVADMGLKSVELACWPTDGEKRRYAGVTHIDVNELDEERVEEIKSYLNEKGVSISSLGYYPNPLSSDVEQSELAISHIYKLIDASKKLSVNMVTTFIGRDQIKNMDDSLKDFVNVWTDIIKYAEKNKVKIAIENCPMLFSKDEWPGGKNLAISPKIFRKMFELIPSDYFGLNFDPSHYVWQRMDYVKTIYDFRDKLFHIHFKDIKVYQDKLDEVGVLAYPLEYMDPRIPGRGDINWEVFIKTLKDVQYAGDCIIEIEDRDYEDTNDKVLESIKLSIKEVNQYL